MDILDIKSLKFANALFENNQKSSTLLGHVLTLLEHFKFQVHKFKLLGYCDHKLAYFCFKASQNVMSLIEGASGKNADQFSKSVTSTIEALHPEFLSVEKMCQIKPTHRDTLQSRLKNLKSNGDTPTHDNPDSLSLKHRDLISCQELNTIMRKSPDSVMLIDFRSQREYQYSHVNYLAVVNIEPQMIKELVTKNPNASDQSLEAALSSSLDASLLEKFKNRSKYDLIVFYNLRYGLSECDGTNAIQHLLNLGTTSPSLTSNPFVKVIELIAYKFEYISSKLKQYPLILNGGLESWYQLFGEAGLTRVSTNSSIKKAVEVSNVSNSAAGRSKYLKNFGDYFSSGLTKNVALKQDHSFAMPGTKAEPVKSDVSSISKHVSREKSGNSNHLNFEETSISHPKPTNHPKPTKLVETNFSTGLTNLGNSCYMNCILQCLAATSPLIEFLMKHVHEGNKGDSQLYKQHINLTNALGTKGIVTNTFVGLLTDMLHRNGAVFTPSTFKRVIGSISPGQQFLTSDQQDCIEFLNFILDSLHEDLNQRLVESAKERAMIMDLSDEQESAREILPIRLASTIEWERYLKMNFSIVVDYFQGQYLSQLKCLECTLTSTTFSAFSILSLPIPEQLNGAKTVLLGQCLDLFVETELLDENNKWHCPRCRRFTKLTKKMTITRLPRVLIIHFKRFKLQGNSFRKLESLVTYPVDDVLDMTNYWPSIGSYTNDLIPPFMDKAKERDYLSSFPIRNQVPPFKYKLYGVANHFGNLTTGHYTSFVQKKSEENGKSEWCYFDDSKVQHGSKPKDVLNANAYCLFYRRI